METIRTIKRLVSQSYFTVKHPVSMLILAALLLVSLPAAAQVQLAFDKSFTPDTIGVGSTTTLRFDITNSDTNPATDLAFSDTLPAGVLIADPASASSSCDGVLNANSGGSVISFSGGDVSGNQSCSVLVDVTSSVLGTHTNVSGDLTSSQGNAGNATDDLSVAADRPGFSKSFSPASVNLGERSTLSFSIDNTANASQAFSLTFTDNLPLGMEVADPANVANTCNGGTVTANAGSGVVSYSPVFFGDASVAAGASCSISVDVTSTAIGLLNNISGDLTSSATIGGPERNSGKASDSLGVSISMIHLIKTFTDDPVLPGGLVNLEFTIFNRTRGLQAANIEFTDDLEATLTGLVATGLPASDVCGAGSQLAGTDLLTLTGGVVEAGQSCTFSVSLQVPADAMLGAYANTTSEITADLDGFPMTGNTATGVLFVDTAPQLSKTFLSNPVGSGESLTMEFTVTNSNPSFEATDIAFTDNLDAFISGTTVTALPANGFCGAGAILSTVQLAGELNLSMTGGSLAAAGSCTFSADILLPIGTANGTFTNTTSEISTTINAVTSVGNPATASLTVASGPSLEKEFIDDPVQPGDQVTLQLTVSYDEEAEVDAVDINFTDDLNSTGLTGLVAVGLPINDICGPGSQISGTDVLAFTGGTLAPGVSCIVQVQLQVPADAVPGSYTNTTSPIVATIGEISATNFAAFDDLRIAGLELTKSFVDDPVIPGATVTLEFSLNNSSATFDATNIVFTDNLGDVVPGLVAVAPLPTDPCGAGSSISGTNFLVFENGSLLAGTGCTFSVTLQVPAGVDSGIYPNITSNLLADINGASLVLEPATDGLEISADLLAFSKSFNVDSAFPGDSVGLEFTITNQSAVSSVTGISFTDDLDAALTGMVAVGLPQNDVCGLGSSLSGSSVITLSNGELAPGASCNFSVTVQIPGDAAFGVEVTNTTSPVTGDSGGLSISGDPAVDSLFIDAIVFTKEFAALEVFPGDSTTLSFTITNFGISQVDRLLFTDDLEAVLTGLVATGLPANDVCGPGSTLTGTSVLTMNGGILAAGAECTFQVTVQIPASALPGSYLNVTSDLVFAGGDIASPPALATLVVSELVVDEKTVLCHKPGTRAEHTIEVANAAVPAHLAHGDYLGPCEGDD